MELSDHGDFHLCCFFLNRHRFAGLLEPFNVAKNGIFGHVPGVLKVLAFGDKAGERGNRHGVSSVLILLEENRVFVEPSFPIFHVQIIAFFR